MRYFQKDKYRCHIALVRHEDTFVCHEDKVDPKNYNCMAMDMVDRMNVPEACLLLIDVTAMVAARTYASQYQATQLDTGDGWKERLMEGYYRCSTTLGRKEGERRVVAPNVVVAFAQSQPPVLEQSNGARCLGLEERDAVPNLERRYLEPSRKEECRDRPMLMDLIGLAVPLTSTVAARAKDSPSQVEQGDEENIPKKSLMAE